MATATSTSIAINDETAQPGQIRIEFDGRRYWHGEVNGFHNPGDVVTVTVHVSSDPGHILTGLAQIKSVRFPEDGDPVTEFFGRESLDRVPLRPAA